MRRDGRVRFDDQTSQQQHSSVNDARELLCLLAIVYDRLEVHCSATLVISTLECDFIHIRLSVTGKEFGSHRFIVFTGTV